MSLVNTKILYKLLKGNYSDFLLGKIMANLPSEKLTEFIYDLPSEFKQVVIPIISKTMKNEEPQMNKAVFNDLLQIAAWSPTYCFNCSSLFMGNKDSIGIMTELIIGCFKNGYRHTIKLILTDLVEELIDDLETLISNYIDKRKYALMGIFELLFSPDENLTKNHSMRSAIVCDLVAIFYPLLEKEQQILDSDYLIDEIFDCSKTISLWVASFPFTKKALQKLNKLDQDWNFVNMHQRNALWYACRYGSLDMVKYLWSRTVDKHVQSRDIDVQSHNLVEVALYYNPRPNVFEFLVKKHQELPNISPKYLILNCCDFIPKYQQFKYIKTLCRKIKCLENISEENYFSLLIASLVHTDCTFREMNYILKQMKKMNTKFVLSSTALGCLFYHFEINSFFDLLINHGFDTPWTGLAFVFKKNNFSLINEYIFKNLSKYPEIPPLKCTHIDIQEAVVSSLVINDFSTKEKNHYINSINWLQQQGIDWNMKINNHCTSKYFSNHSVISYFMDKFNYNSNYSQILEMLVLFGANLDQIESNTKSKNYPLDKITKKITELKKIQTQYKQTKKSIKMLQVEIKSTPPIPYLYPGGMEYFNLKERFSANYGTSLPKLATPIHASPGDLIRLDRISRIKTVCFSPKADGLRCIKKSRGGPRVLAEIISERVLIFGLVRQELNWFQQMKQIQEIPEVKEGTWEIKPCYKMLGCPVGELLKRLSTRWDLDYPTDGVVLSAGERDPLSRNLIFYKEKPLKDKTIDLLWDPQLKSFLTRHSIVVADCQPIESEAIIWRLYWKDNLWIPGEPRPEKKKANKLYLVNQLRWDHRFPWSPIDLYNLERKTNYWYHYFNKTTTKRKNSPSWWLNRLPGRWLNLACGYSTLNADEVINVDYDLMLMRKNTIWLDVQIPWDKSSQKYSFGLTRNKTLWERTNLLELSPLRGQFQGIRMDLCLNHFDPENLTWLNEINQRTTVSSRLQISFLNADKLFLLLGENQTYTDPNGGFYRIINKTQVRVFIPMKHLEPITEYLISFNWLNSVMSQNNWRLNLSHQVNKSQECYYYGEWIKI